MPIVSTSANIAGEKPIIKMNQLENYFGNKIDYIVEGQIGNNKQPSRILDLLTHEVLREGDQMQEINADNVLEVRNYLLDLQNNIIAMVCKYDNNKFIKDEWVRDEGGGVFECCIKQCKEDVE